MLVLAPALMDAPPAIYAHVHLLYRAIGQNANSAASELNCIYIKVRKQHQSLLLNQCNISVRTHHCNILAQRHKLHHAMMKQAKKVSAYQEVSSAQPGSFRAYSLTSNTPKKLQPSAGIITLTFIARIHSTPPDPRRQSIQL